MAHRQVSTPTTKRNSQNQCTLSHTPDSLCKRLVSCKGCGFPERRTHRNTHAKERNDTKRGTHLFHDFEHCCRVKMGKHWLFLAEVHRGQSVGVESGVIEILGGHVTSHHRHCTRRGRMELRKDPWEYSSNDTLSFVLGR